jgi:hypothetical protein
MSKYCLGYSKEGQTSPAFCSLGHYKSVCKTLLSFSFHTLRIYNKTAVFYGKSIEVPVKLLFFRMKNVPLPVAPEGDFRKHPSFVIV